MENATRAVGSDEGREGRDGLSGSTSHEGRSCHPSGGIGRVKGTPDQEGGASRAGGSRRCESQLGVGKEDRKRAGGGQAKTIIVSRTMQPCCSLGEEPGET